MTDNKPIHRIRLGVVAASIFANPKDESTFYNVQIDRSYKDGESWNHTRSFGRDDLLNVAKVADLAHSWIHAQQQADRSSGLEENAAEISEPAPWPSI